MQHDQETEIGDVSVVFAQEKSENRQAKKSRHVLDGSTGKETRTSHSVLQAALNHSEPADTSPRLPLLVPANLSA